MARLPPRMLALVLLAAAPAGAAAAEPYYDPRNAASPTGYTTAYELSRSIGCPGHELLAPHCLDRGGPPGRPRIEITGHDADFDEVPDERDYCPGTPWGRRVDARGCELDGDRDGVGDFWDECPASPPGVWVDARGCHGDGDADGVMDGWDYCPHTPPRRRVDSRGCEPDRDRDGVPDDADYCPGTPIGVAVEASGCPPLRPPSPPPAAPVRGLAAWPTVWFDLDSAALRPEAQASLEAAAAQLLRHPARLELAGHADEQGGAAYNLALSQRRARAVRDFLVARGVPSGQLLLKGYGESRPVAGNDSETGRARNRRVELVVPLP